MSATSVPVCQGLLFSFFLNYEPHKCKAQGFRQSHPVPVIYLLPLSSRFTRNMVYDLYDLCMVCKYFSFTVSTMFRFGSRGHCRDTEGGRGFPVPVCTAFCFFLLLLHG